MLKDKYSILIAEDEQANYQLLEALLTEEIELSCMIHHALNGKETIDYCEKNSDIVDINMPVMNGFEATINIRKFMPDVPIVIVTANSDDKNREKGYAIGSSDFLGKPIDVAILAGIVEKYVTKL